MPVPQLSRLRAILARVAVRVAAGVVGICALSHPAIVAAQSVPGLSVSNFATVAGARAVTLDPAGNVYSMGTISGIVYKISPSGVSTAIASLGAPNWFVGPYYEPVSGNVMVSQCYNSNTNAILRIDSAGAVSVLATGLPCAGGFASDAAGNLYVSMWVTAGSVVKITPAGVVTTYATGFNLPDGIDFGPGGELYVGNRATDQIFRVPAGGGAATVFASGGGLSDPLDVVVDQAGYVYAANFGNGTISKISPSGVVSVYGTGFASPDGLAFGANGSLYVSDYGLNAVFKVHTPETFFTDTLANNSNSINVSIPAAKYSKIASGLRRNQNSTGGGDASSNTDRPVVKTKAASYLAEAQFTAEVTLDLTSPDLAYFGFGQGTPDSNYFQEPSQAFIFRVHRSWTGNSSIQVWPTTLGSGLAHFFNFENGNDSLGTYGGGPLRLKIERNGDNLTMSIPSMGASYTFSILQFAGAMGLNGSNAYIFFGNTNVGSVFSNLDIYRSIADTTAPAITAPADITVEADSAAGTAVSFNASAMDDVDGSVGVTADPASGSTFGIGNTTVELSASDAAGNEATASFTVTVQDTTAPVVTAPADIVAEATSADGAAVSYPPATATDAVGVTSSNSNPPSGSTFPLGSTTVIATARDAAGNTGADDFTITVVDTTAPSVAGVTTSTGSLWPPNHQMVNVGLAITASDLVGVVKYHVTVSSNEPDNGLGDGDTANDIQISGNGTLNPQISLRSERRGGGTGRVYTITVTAVDAAGNSASRTATVSVPKSQAKK